MCGKPFPDEVLEADVRGSLKGALSKMVEANDVGDATETRGSQYGESASTAETMIAQLLITSEPASVCHQTVHICDMMRRRKQRSNPMSLADNVLQHDFIEDLISAFPLVSRTHLREIV